MSEVKSMIIKDGMKIHDLVKEFKKSGAFGAGRIARAVEILAAMLSDDDATIYIGIAGAMCAAGLREIFAKLIREKGLDEKYVDLRMFYDKILESRIFFINQPEPKGFGDAVLRAEGFVGDDPFLLHAGDDLVLSDNTSHLRNLINTFNELRGDVTLLVERVEDPRSYGVILPRKIQGYSHIFKIEDIVEKPKKPPSNYAVVGIYILNKKIFETLKDIGPDSKGELQLTTAIRQIIKSGGEGYAVMLDEGERRLDVGNPFNYYLSLIHI